MTDRIPSTGDIFLHYKGAYYEVLFLGAHTETGEKVVIYRQCMDPSAQVWVRPLAMFCEKIGERQNVDRFMLIRGEALEVLKRTGVL